MLREARDTEDQEELDAYLEGDDLSPDIHERALQLAEMGGEVVLDG